MLTAYRYHEQLVSQGDEEYGFHSHIEIYIETFEVLSQTKTGFWIRYYDQKRTKRFVSNFTRKRFACLNKEDARLQFIARKKAQLRILNGRIYNIKIALERAENGFIP